MKFTVFKQELLTELKALRSVIDKKSEVAIPTLLCVLIEAADGLTLTTTDLGIALKTTCPAEVEEPGATALNAKKLFKIVESLPGSVITFSTAANNDLVTITSERVKFELLGMDKDGFPDKLPQAGQFTMSIRAGVIGKQIGRTLYAITQEESRYALNGALFELGDSALKMVATDGHRMSLTSAPCLNPAGVQRKAIVPKKALAVIAKLAADHLLGTVDFGFSDEGAYFKLDNRILSSRLESGRFPDYTKVIPEENKTIITVNTGDFTRAIARVSSMADKRQCRPIDLKFGEGMLAVSARDADYHCAEEVIPVRSDLEFPKIRFQSRYLLDFLETVHNEEITLAMKPDADQDPRVVTWKPVGDEDYTHIVCAMRDL